MDAAIRGSQESSMFPSAPEADMERVTVGGVLCRRWGVRWFGRNASMDAGLRPTTTVG